MEPTITFFSLVALKKLADALGLTDALKKKRKDLAGKILDRALPKPIKKALDDFLGNKDVAPLFAKAFAELEFANKSIKRTFTLKILTDPAILQAIAGCEKGTPPQPEMLTPLFAELLPGHDAQTTAEAVMESFYRALAENQALLGRLQIADHFLLERIEAKIDKLTPGEAAPILSLPDAPPKFVGRESDLEKLRQRLAVQQGVATVVGGKTAGVHGMGGIGKSYLAIQFAHECLAENCFPDGILFQACGGNTVESIVSEMCIKAAVAAHDLPYEQALQTLKTKLAPRRLLLILDDVQNNEIEEILPGGRVSTLITSRRRDLPFLSENAPVDVEIFTEAECTALFRDFLGDAVDAHTEDACAIFEAVGYLPIAVSVAAGMLRDSVQWTFPELRAFLSEDSGLSGLQHRDRNVEKVLTQAITRLPEAEQKLLCAMAACAAGGFSFSLACRVAECGETAGLPGLQKLLDHSLVREIDREQRRYFLHALVRQSAAQRPFYADLPEKHARLIKDDFREWEKDWRTLQEFLPEARQAMNWVLQKKRGSPGFMLGYRAYELYRRIGRLQEALEFMRDHEKLAAQLEDKDGLQACYGNQALILKAWGRLEEALALHKKEEAICLELGNKDGLQACYGNQALILQAWGRLEEALALHKKKEAICLELGNKDGLQACYGNQALILADWGRLEEALALHKQEEAICLELGNKDGLQACYGNQALILKAWGRLEEALALHKQEEAICLELGNQDSLQISYGNQALILKAWGRLEDALALHKQEEAICLELGNQSSLAYCYWNMALLFEKQKENAKALGYAGQSLEIFTKLKMPREREAVQEIVDRLKKP